MSWTSMRVGHARVLALICVALLARSGAARAEVRVDARPERPPAEADVTTKDGKLELSLEEAVRIALARNLGLVVERYTRSQRRVGLGASLASYDLLAAASVTTSDAKSATLAADAASQETSYRGQFSLAQKLPTGGELSFAYGGNRSESDDPDLPPIAIYGNGSSFTLTQPLLRNFGRFVADRDIVVARRDDEVSREAFEQQVTSTLLEVVNAYWALVNAREQLVVAEESLALAKELHQRNQIQVDVGTLAPLELVQSEAAIATREEGIISAKAAIGDAEDQLRGLLNLPAGELWSTDILPVTDPRRDRVTVDVDEAIRTAYAERPELRTQELAVELAEITARFQDNQVKPSLGLTLTYDLGGVGLSYSDALEQVYGFDFPTWTAALSLGIPIQNRAARAAKAGADLDLERARTQLEDLKTVIATEVRRAARAVTTAAQQIEASKVSRQFQEKNLEAERKRYENAMSTSFQITQIQEQVTQARRNEVAALIGYRTALAEYYRTIGRLLAEEGVAIDDPTSADGPVRWWSFDRDLERN